MFSSIEQPHRLTKHREGVAGAGLFLIASIWCGSAIMGYVQQEHALHTKIANVQTDIDNTGATGGIPPAAEITYEQLLKDQQGDAVDHLHTKIRFGVFFMGAGLAGVTGAMLTHSQERREENEDIQRDIAHIIATGQKDYERIYGPPPHGNEQ